MEPRPNDLLAVLNRVATGVWTEADLTALRQAVQNGQVTLATGERAVAVGGNVTDTVIITGNGNIVRIVQGREKSVLEAVTDLQDNLSGLGALPGKSYRLLVGRERLIGEIMMALQDPAGKWIVTVDGMGGIGKTAIVREAVERSWNEKLFEALVWEQAPRAELDSPKNSLTFETALDAVARQLGMLDVPRLPLVEKQARLRAHLQNRRVLIVLDNLETAQESQNEIAFRLRPLLNPSKALLTSRRRFQGDLYAIHLEGLDQDGTQSFIRQEAEEKRIQRLASAKAKELKQIGQVTGGSPLALKLVVGQLGHLPLETVLYHLREIRLPEQESDTDDYYRFYKFIFFPSWELLSEQAQGLLIAMAHFAPGVGGTFEAIRVTSDLVETQLAHSVDELWRLAFLEVGATPRLKQIRYYLHALTQYFVLSDIVQI